MSVCRPVAGLSDFDDLTRSRKTASPMVQPVRPDVISDEEAAYLLLRGMVEPTADYVSDHEGALLLETLVNSLGGLER
jgi:hypothetical protein